MSGSLLSKHRYYSRLIVSYYVSDLINRSVAQETFRQVMGSIRITSFGECIFRLLLQLSQIAISDNSWEIAPW